MRCRALLLVLAIGWGCSANEPRLQTNLTIFDDALASTISVEPERLLVPRAGNEWIGALPQSQVLASGYRAGFLRRLDGITTDGEQFVIATTQAGLPDAIVDGRFGGTMPIDATSMALDAQRFALLTGDSLATGLTLEDIVLTEKDGARIVLKRGFVRFTPTVSLDVEIEDSRLHHVDLAIAADAELHATFAFQAEQPLTASVDQKIWEGPPYYQWFFVGPFPVAVEYRLSLTLYGEIALECGIDAEADADVTARVDVGARYDGVDAVMRGSQSLTGAASWPTLNRPAPIAAKVSLRPRLDAKLYGVAGPFLTTGTYVKGVLAAPYERTVYGGAEANFGGQLQILDPLDDKVALVDKTIQSDFLTQEWLLFNDTSTDEPIGCAMAMDGGGDTDDLRGADLLDMSVADQGEADLSAADLGELDGAVDFGASDLGNDDLGNDDLAITDLPSPDLAGRCAMLPPLPNTAEHFAFDDETSAPPLASCGHAIAFNGGEGHTIGFGEAMNAGPFTLSLWLRPTSDPPYDSTQFIAGNQQFGTWPPGWRLDFVITPDPANLYLGYVTVATASVGSFVTRWPGPSGQWHHVAITSDGAVANVFLDGRRVVDAFQFPGSSNSFVATTPSFPIVVGGLPLGAHPFPPEMRFHGDLDDFRIYDHVLNDDEIRALSCSCGQGDMATPEDLAVPPDLALERDIASPPDLSSPPDLATEADLPLVACTQDAGVFFPPNRCDLGNDATSTAAFVVCAANCDRAWISASAAGGTYHPLAICEALGYKRLGAIGTTGGAECGAFESGTSCNNHGLSTFNGLGSLGGDAYGNNVHWECLPN